MPSLNSQEKLVLLRRFAADNLYSAQYLSLLVQRKKLKASKAGRNFYTCEKWFFEYLEKHARDDIRVKYKKLFTQIKQSQIKNIDASSKILRGEAELSRAALPAKTGAFVWLKTNMHKLSTAILLLFFVVFIAGRLFAYIDSGQGRVSGIQESHIRAASSTESIISD